MGQTQIAETILTRKEEKDIVLYINGNISQVGTEVLLRRNARVYG